MKKKMLDQTTRHSIQIERYKSGSVKEFDKILAKMNRAIKSQLAGENITAWKRSRLESQLKSFAKIIDSYASDAKTLVNKQVVDLAIYEAEFEIKSLKNLTEGRADFTAPSEKQIRAAVYSAPLNTLGPSGGMLLESYQDGWSQRTTQRVDGAIRLGYALGDTTESIVSNIVGTGGAGDLARRDLEAIVRTGLQHTASVARAEVWSANSDIVTHYQIIATLDDKTTDICQALDGQRFENGQGPFPPLHVNCRSTTIGVLSPEFDFLSKDATRASKDEDGKYVLVDAKSNYYDWLKRQPESVQDMAVGPVRGQLLRGGGLSSGRFAELQLNKRFEPITLKEMRELDPVAFDRAGL